MFGVQTGNLVFFNALLLADGIPASIYAALAWLVPHRPVLRRIAGMLAAGYALAWITLEIRRGFYSRVELFGGSTDIEWYLYSVAWLAFAVAALAIGLVRDNDWLRRAGLAGVGLVVAKVFLSDMAELEGVLRALSFIGLGGALVGLGYDYRRLRPHAVRRHRGAKRGLVMIAMRKRALRHWSADWGMIPGAAGESAPAVIEGETDENPSLPVPRMDTVPP